MVKKCLDNNICSNNFLGHFQRLQHGKNTRNNNISVKIPKIKLESTKKAYFCRGAIEFNKLPPDIKPYAVSRSNNKTFDEYLVLCLDLSFQLLLFNTVFITL